MPDRSFEDSPGGADPWWREPGPLRDGVVGLALAGGLTFAAARVAGGVAQVVLACLAVLACAYAVYTIGILLVFVVFVRVLDGLGRVRREGLRDRWPVLVRVLVPLLVFSWALSAWLYGYDATEWLWTGISIVMAVVAIAVITRRRRREPVLDGPDAPRHRSPSV